jgi:hypothetical protein
VKFEALSESLLVMPTLTNLRFRGSRKVLVSTDLTLASPGEGRGPQPDSGGGDRRVAIGPVMAAAGEQAHCGAFSAVDLMHPVWTGGWLDGANRNAGVNEAIGAEALGEHARLR